MRPAPTPPPSQRPSGVPASAGSDMSHPGTGYLGHTSAHAVPASSGGLNGGALGAPRLSHPPAPEVPGVRPLDPAFFGDALDAAMALVHADSGELATLDDSRQRLVLRARRTRARMDGGLGAFGARGPASHPMRVSQTSLGQNALTYGDPLADIEQQATDLLPGILLTRTYRPGERLIGHTWQRGEPVIMRGEDCRALPGGMAPADQDAPWHLAVPIIRTGSFVRPRAGRQIVGVIAVHNRDPHWSFSPRDIELLVLHADRVASSMEAAELARQTEGQAALLEVLRGTGSPSPDLPSLYVRVREVVGQLVDVSSFALLLLEPRSEELVFAVVERGGQSLSLPPLAVSAAPGWWSVVRRGRVLCISAPEDRAARPDLCVLGWGGNEAVQSLLAAPLVVGNTLLGAIVAGCPQADAYAPEQARLFETVARSAAIVIENAQLADETRRHLLQAHAKSEQLAAINNAVLTLNSSLDLDTTLRHLVHQAKALTSAQVCVAFLLDDAGEELVARATNLDLASDPTSGGATRPTVSLGEVRVPLKWRGVGGAVAREQFIVLDGLDSDYDDSPLGRLLAQERVASVLVLPVVHQGSPIGALAVYTPGQRHNFPPEEISLLQGLASQAAVAVSNARLYHQLERAYERQKELDRYKDEFILTVSHEFRTPLTAIEGYVSLIGRHADRLQREKLEEFAEQIHTATTQLAGMITMLADANRMSSQVLNLALRPVNLRETVETAVRQYPPESVARIDDAVPPDCWVPADGERLRLVISNLVSNALKYSPAHEPCVVTAAREQRGSLARRGVPVATGSGAPESWVVVSVVDRGEGIAPEDQANLFQKFVRLTRSLTTPVRGTGLGLWICRQYVEAMGGSIWVESEIGKGSAFRFCLPAAGPP